MIKIAINTCIGGFALSEKAIKRLIALGNSTAKLDYELAVEAAKDINEDPKTLYSDSGFTSSLKRDDPQLIQVIEELGVEAETPMSSIKIIEIPDGVEWYIDNDIGVEEVHEVHRKWY